MRRVCQTLGPADAGSGQGKHQQTPGVRKAGGVIGENPPGRSPAAGSTGRIGTPFCPRQRVSVLDSLLQFAPIPLSLALNNHYPAAKALRRRMSWGGDLRVMESAELYLDAPRRSKYVSLRSGIFAQGARAANLHEIPLPITHLMS